MEILHVQAFVDQYDGDRFKTVVSSELHTIHTEKILHEHIAGGKFDEVFEQYKQYSKKTSEGVHGKTAQFWFGYIEMLHVYHEFIRSIRLGDLELYIYCFPRINYYFFTFNHSNYARLPVRYHDNLLKLSETHKDVYDEFKKGCFGIKRTKKDFSRLPIDLTLEQTVNTDPANQQTEISYFTNSMSARQRWADSHSVRMEVLSEVLNKINMTTKENVSQDQKPNRIMKNTRDLEKILRNIRENMNPFSEEVNKDLPFDIGTGKSSKQETAEFLLNINEIGQKAREAFIIQ